MHGTATPRVASADPKAERIARLSEEFLSASARRKTEIGEEIAGLIADRIYPFAQPT